MNIFLNEYFGFCFELNFELNHFSARFNEKMNFQNVSHTPRLRSDKKNERPEEAPLLHRGCIGKGSQSEEEAEEEFRHLSRSENWDSQS